MGQELYRPCKYGTGEFRNGAVMALNILIWDRRVQKWGRNYADHSKTGQESSEMRQNIGRFKSKPSISWLI